MRHSVQSGRASSFAAPAFDTSKDTMSQPQPYKLPFESRLVLQSRAVVDERGDIGYKHNSWLEGGEHVELAEGGADAIVMEGSHWHPFTRREFVRVLLRREDGSEELLKLPASAVRRKYLYKETD